VTSGAITLETADIQLGLEQVTAHPGRLSKSEVTCHGVARRSTVEPVTEHYTLRPAPGMRERVSERAHRVGLAGRTLAQRYLEEGLRHDAHPLIQFLDGPDAVADRPDLVGLGDRALLETATNELRAVVTNNVKDFRLLVSERLARGQALSGLSLSGRRAAFESEDQVQGRVDLVRVLRGNPSDPVYEPRADQRL